MSFKTTYILFGILILVVGVFALTQITHKQPPSDVAYVLPTLHDDKITASDITGVEIQTFEPKYKSQDLVFTRTDSGWQVKDPNVRADHVAIDQAVSDVMRAAREKEGVDITDDLKKFGLEPPAATVTLKKGDQQWKLNIGDQSVGKTNALVYVTSSDRPKEVMAVRRSNLNSLFTRERVASASKATGKSSDEEVDRIKTLADFRSRELLGEGVVNLPETVTQVTLQQPKAFAVVLKKDEGSHWRFSDPKLGPADTDGETGNADSKKVSGVRDLLRDLSDLRVASTSKSGATDDQSAPDFVADNVSNMATYGLEGDKPATLKIQIVRTPSTLGRNSGSESKEPVTETLLVGNKVDDKYYARLGNEKSVVKIAADKLTPLLQVAADPDPLRSRDLVQADQSKIDAVDIKGPNGLIKLREPETGAWKITSPGSKDERKADSQAVSGLLGALTAKKQIQSFPKPSEEAQLGFDQPSTTTVSLWENGFEKKEAKDGKAATPKIKDEQHPTVRLTFGKKDEKSVYVRREADGEKTIVAVPVSVVDKLSEPAVAYLDRALPKFAANAEVTKLTLDRGGEAFDVVRGDAKSAWKFDKPKDLAGRPADARNVEQIVGDLRDLVAEKLVAENPSDAQLDAYGLKTPAIKANLIVKADKKNEDWTYLIGKETADKSGYYATQGGHGLVFVVRAPVVEALKAELQDPTVFHFNPDTIREIKITGWRKAMGFNMTLDLQRAAGTKNWTVKAPDAFELDQTQADAFAANLADLRADRILVRRTGPRPEFKLDDKNRNLQIEISVDGQKSPYTLTIGDVDAKEKGYYAESSNLKGDVVLLPQARFEKVVDTGIRHFSKAVDKTTH
jgi:hypothetical protein